MVEAVTFQSRPEPGYWNAFNIQRFCRLFAPPYSFLLTVIRDNPIGSHTDLVLCVERVLTTTHT